MDRRNNQNQHSVTYPTAARAGSTVLPTARTDSTNFERFDQPRVARPRVTIGLPFYNNAKTLADAIRSVFCQTFQDWELLLVDDGSRDESLAIARAIDDPRVRVDSDGENRGLACRLNEISRLARGQFIARMDGDDLMHPERIERELRFLDEHPEVDIVGTGVYTIDAANRPVGVRGCQKLQLSASAVLSRYLYEHVTVMARSEWFRGNPYDETYDRAQDYELWCRAVIAGKTTFGKLREPLFFVREEGTMTLTRVLCSYRSLRRVFGQHGPAMADRARLWQLGLRLRLKAGGWRLASWLGLQGALISRRNRRLEADQLRAAQEMLSRIAATRVPGLDEVAHQPEPSLSWTANE